MIFFLYLLYTFTSQFKYILDFNAFGFYFNPARIILMVLIVYDVLLVSRGKIKHNGVKNNIWLKTLVLWNIWALLSIIWAKDFRGLIRTEIVLFEAMAFVYYSQKILCSRDRINRTINTVLWALFIHNILGWIEVLFKIYFFSKYTEKYSTHGYPVSTFTNTNNFGFYLALMGIVLIYKVFLFNNKRKISKIVFSGLLVSTVLLLLRTGSRGAIMAFFLGVLIITVFVKMSTKKTIVMLSLFLGIPMLCFFVPSFSAYFESIYLRVFHVNLNATRGSDFYRVNMILNGLDFFGNTYGLGVGLGNVEYWMEHYGTRFTNYIYNLHNWWLEVLVGSGFVVLFAVLRSWWKSLKTIFYNYKRNANMSTVFLAFAATFALGCISPSSLYSSEWPWTVLGLYFSLVFVLIPYKTDGFD